jgi:hypothetical protein
MNQTTYERLANLARSIDGMHEPEQRMKHLSKEDACAVALLLNRLDLVNYEHPLTALDQLSPECQETVRELHRGGACLPLGLSEHND